MYEEYILISVENNHKLFNPETGMIQWHVEPWSGGGGGYHTRLSGDIHNVRFNIEYANNVFFLRKEEYYEEAKSALMHTIKAQDTREGSKTYGLWPYYVEEDCDHMLAPDYNMADFNSKNLAYILKRRFDCIDEEMRTMISDALMRAAECSIRRNVSPDYTNISLMSLNTIIIAGELSGNKALLERGKERLRKVYEYNMFSQNYSEFNSPTYTPLAIEELGIMLEMVEDEECLKMARDLNYLAWDMFLRHYHKELRELCPPHMRAYSSFNNNLPDVVYLGTNGRYGMLNTVDIPYPKMMQIMPVCPEELIKKYLEPAQKTVFLDETFYKKNNIRTPDEDTVIIRNLESPDLKSFTYITGDYSMGAFEKTDMWTQRRSSMVYWGNGEHKASVRIRCINKDYDYCSGMVYTNQFENVMLSHCGFVTDRGDFHYILDKTKDGKLTTEKLFFKFELEGDCENVTVTQDGTRFTISDKGIKIDINILEAVFEGQPMRVFYNEADKCVEAVCFDGERTIDFNETKTDCYMIFTMAVNETCPIPVSTKENGMVSSEVFVKGKRLTLTSPSTPLSYDEAIEKTMTAGGD